MVSQFMTKLVVVISMFLDHSQVIYYIPRSHFNPCKHQCIEGKQTKISYITIITTINPLQGYI